MSKILKLANQFAIKLATDDYQNEMWEKYYPIVTVQFFGGSEDPIEGYEEPEILKLSLRETCLYFINKIDESEVNQITGEIITVQFGWIQAAIKRRGKVGVYKKLGVSNKDYPSVDELYQVLLNFFFEIFGSNFNPDRLGKGKNQ